MKRGWTLLATVLLLSFMSGVVLAGTSPAHKEISRDFTGAKAFEHIRTLASVSRVAGSPREYQAALYCKSFFEGLGYETSMQTFPVVYFEAFGWSLEVTAPEEHAGPLNPNILTYSAPGDVEGELVYCGLGTVDELEGLDLTGKIALIKRGAITFMEKAENAKAKGAIGVVIFNHSPGNFSGTLQKPVGIAAVSLSLEEGSQLLEWMGAGPVVVHLL
ncbi:MAG: hypothetical protein NUV93_00850, partial [Firmicutes bacterium]|nr:hypothetical protein [Bacillota bacterium]